MQKITLNLGKYSEGYSGDAFIPDSVNLPEFVELGGVTYFQFESDLYFKVHRLLITETPVHAVKPSSFPTVLAICLFVVIALAFLILLLRA